MKLCFPLREQTLEILTAIERQNEICGSEIVKDMSNPTPKSIYVVLGRLEDGGWLQSRVEKVRGERNRPRRYYQLTQLGNEALKFQRACQEAVAEQD